MDEVLDHTGPFHSFVILVPGFLHLVAYAPEDDAGMVAVAKDHIGDILLPPFVEDFRVVAGFPFVKRLVDDEESHPVAHIQHFPGRLVVRHTDGVGAVFLEDFEPALVGPVGNGGPESSGVLVDGYALEFDLLPVKGESFVLVELEPAHSERGAVRVHRLTAGLDRGFERVKVGVVYVPQNRVGEYDIIALALGDHCPGSIQDAVRQVCLHPFGVDQRHFDVYFCLFRSDLRGGDVGAVGVDVHRVGIDELDVAVYAASGVPARAVADCRRTDGDKVLRSVLDVWRQVVMYGRETVRVRP